MAMRKKKRVTVDGLLNGVVYCFMSPFDEEFAELLLQESLKLGFLNRIVSAVADIDPAGWKGEKDIRQYQRYLLKRCVEMNRDLEGV